MATCAQILRVRVLAKISALLASTLSVQNGIFKKYAGLARLADICQALLQELARLANIHQRPKMRKICLASPNLHE
jgi:hypothetical protein